MKATLKFCGEQILRLDGLTGYASMGAEGFRERATALMESAGTEELAAAAISALLADTVRASSVDTNRLPSAGEIRLWAESLKPQRYEESGTTGKSGCGRCEGGWVFVTRRIIPRGQTLPQEYTFAGKCPTCYGPGWYAGSS